MKENVLVIDTNLIFSGLISSSSAIRDILLENHFEFYAPNYIIAELFKHKEKMLKYSKLTESEFYVYFNGIVEQIRFTPLDFISLQSKQEAYDLCKDVDIKDTPFVALAIELNVPLWTGDKKLMNGLRQKGFDNFFDPGK
jgi:putative PIN family toxin of toxin-antitoxin system